MLHAFFINRIASGVVQSVVVLLHIQNSIYKNEERDGESIPLQDATS